MKTILLFLFVIAAVVGYANDTLTRMQVYNFSIGDTFEYQTSQQTSQVNPVYNPGPITTSLFRQVITDVYYSSANDTLYVVKTPSPYNFFFMEADVPNAVNFFSDTLVITNLTDYEIYYHYYGSFMDTTYSLTDTLNGRRVNGTTCAFSLGVSYTEDIFGEGLGLVSRHQAGGDGYYVTDLRMVLKYYSKGTETWGTPQPVGIKQYGQQQNNFVSTFPNPFTTRLTFKISDNEPTTLSLYNFLGQQVLQQTVTNSATINTEHLADGIYFYELRNDKGLVANGKVIRQ